MIEFPLTLRPDREENHGDAHEDAALWLLPHADIRWAVASEGRHDDVADRAGVTIERLEEPGNPERTHLDARNPQVWKSIEETMGDQCRVALFKNQGFGGKRNLVYRDITLCTCARAVTNQSQDI